MPRNPFGRSRRIQVGAVPSKEAQIADIEEAEQQEQEQQLLREQATNIVNMAKEGLLVDLEGNVMYDFGNEMGSEMQSVFFDINAKRKNVPVNISALDIQKVLFSAIYKGNLLYVDTDSDSGFSGVYNNNMVETSLEELVASGRELHDSVIMTKVMATERNLQIFEQQTFSVLGTGTNKEIAEFVKRMNMDVERSFGGESP